MGIIGKAFWRSWNINKAAEILKKGSHSDMISFHRYYSGMNNEELKSPVLMRRIVKFNAFAKAGFLIIGLTIFVKLKNATPNQKKMV